MGIHADLQYFAEKNNVLLSETEMRIVSHRHCVAFMTQAAHRIGLYTLC